MGLNASTKANEPWKLYCVLSCALAKINNNKYFSFLIILLSTHCTMHIQEPTPVQHLPTIAQNNIIGDNYDNLFEQTTYPTIFKVKINNKCILNTSAESRITCIGNKLGRCDVWRNQVNQQVTYLKHQCLIFSNAHGMCLLWMMYFLPSS